MPNTAIFVATAIMLATSLSSPRAAAADAAEQTIVLKDHRYEPSTIEIPAGQRVKLIVDNQDPTPEEFESNYLRIEKIVAGNASITVWVGPLKAGEYPFIGEFHQETAFGTIVAK